MADIIYPTDLDIGVNPGDGNLGSEDFATLWANYGQRRNYVVSGLKAVASVLTLTLDPGAAFIEGFRYEESSPVQTTVPSGDGTYWTWMRLNRTGGDVDGITFTHTTTSSAVHSDGIRIAQSTVSGGVITALVDLREGPPGVRSGLYSGNGDTIVGQDIQVYQDAIKPTLVQVSSLDPVIFGQSRLFARQDGGGYQGLYIETLPAQFLEGQKTWDPGLVSGNGGFVATTLTVTGAALGDPVTAGLDSLPGPGADWLLAAHVSAANTVRVLLFNHDAPNRDPASGTLKAYVQQQKEHGGDRTYLSSATGGVKIPDIASSSLGFVVKADAADAINLNASGKLYRWIAFI